MESENVVQASLSVKQGPSGEYEKRNWLFHFFSSFCISVEESGFKGTTFFWRQKHTLSSHLPSKRESVLDMGSLSAREQSHPLDGSTWRHQGDINSPVMPTAKCSPGNGPAGNTLPCSSISLVKRSFRMASILCPLWSDHSVVCCESSFGLTENYWHFTCQLRVNVYGMPRAGEAADWQRGTEMWSQESRENALAQNTLTWSVTAGGGGRERDLI